MSKILVVAIDKFLLLQNVNWKKNVEISDFLKQMWYNLPEDKF